MQPNFIPTTKIISSFSSLTQSEKDIFSDKGVYQPPAPSIKIQLDFLAIFSKPKDNIFFV